MSNADTRDDPPPATYPGSDHDATTRKADTWPRHKAKAHRMKRARLVAARLARR